MISQLKLFFIMALVIETIAGQQAHPTAKNMITQSKTVYPGIAPVIKAHTLDDKEVLISYNRESKNTVLYIFSPLCSWCARNWDNVKTLAKIAGKTNRFFGLALNATNLQEHIRTTQVSFPIYKELSPETISKLELGPAPQTIVVSPNGKIMKNWVGVYGGDIQREVEAFFRVKLPGVNVQSPTDPQYCAYCIWNGLLNSPGAVVKVDGKQIRCRQNGKWTAPY